jgi:hypothetical protein
MVLTNLLLGVGFTLISNFSNSVGMPGRDVPKVVEDLRYYAVGAFESPVNMYLISRDGASFWIKKGAVTGYASPDSYHYTGANSRSLDPYMGEASLDRQQATELAIRVIKRLAKNGDPFPGLPPKQHPLEDYKGKPIPFYWFTWVKTNSIFEQGYAAACVEVDARTSQITYVNLFDEAFYDRPFEQDLKNRFSTPEKPPTNVISRTPPRVLPLPSTNEVLKALQGLPWFCHKFGFSTGSGRAFGDINWSNTCVFPDPRISAATNLCELAFRDNSRFTSIDGVGICYCAGDACFVEGWDVRSAEGWIPFKGKVTKRWEDLARGLEELLVGIGMSKEQLAPYFAQPRFNFPGSGTNSLKRVLVDWRDWKGPADYKGRTVMISETKLALSAEFDLETGELKSIDFFDPAFTEALRKLQSKDLAQHGGAGAVH